MMSTSSTTLLQEKNLTGEFRLEFHQKNDQVIAKLYQGNKEQGTHNLEGVSAEDWNVEPITEIVQDNLNKFLKNHGIQLDSERVTVVIPQELNSIARTFSPISSSSSSVSHFISQDRLFEPEEEIMAATTRSGTHKARLISPCQMAQLALKDAKNIYEAYHKPIRLAVLSYLLQYQHYNAEFIISENKRLGYPDPLCMPQEQPGYIRTEYHRLFELIEVWLKKTYSTCHTFEKRDEGQFGKMKLTTAIAPSVLEVLYLTSIQDLESFSNNLPIKPSREDYTVLVEVGLEDLSLSLEEIVKDKLKSNPKCKIGNIRQKCPEVRFLFLAHTPDIDCALVWGAKWKAPKKNNELDCQSLDAIFGKDVFTCLSKVGAIPDRIAVNRFLTRELGGDWLNDLDALGISTPSSDLICESQSKQYVKLIEEISLKLDPGSMLYRDALLQWNACFFEKYDLLEFAAPLLNSQVASWITEDSGVVEWAKAYQNLNEIVMLCLQSFPDRFKELNLEDTIIQFLPQEYKGQTCHKSVGLLPYAMSSLFCIFDNVFKCKKFGKQVRMGSISQNYFEILELLEKMQGSKCIASQKCDLINDLTEIPDVLVADIHPNNAARKELFQNDVVGWTKAQLEKNPQNTMILVLDITLNHLSDKEVVETLEGLYPFVENGQLEIFALQSLAKLVQLGADNFSGGLCIYLGKAECNKEYPHFPPSFQDKAQFFTLLHLNFGEIIRYFEQVRKNTDTMYTTLKRSLSRMSKVVSIIPNVDSDTVYVSLNFTPLLDTLQIGKSKKNENERVKAREAYVSKLRKDILDLAGKRQLPLTGRQSFGFSLSNMSGVCESIRFSIGVDVTYQRQYIELINQYVEALSKGISQDKIQFDWEKYTSSIHAANSLLLSEEEFRSEEVSLVEENLDEDGNDTLDKIGTARFVYANKEFKLEVNEGDESQTIESSNIKLGAYATEISKSDLFLLFFHIEYLKIDSIYVNRECNWFAIEGVTDFGWEFQSNDWIIDSVSKIKVSFDPFTVELSDGRSFRSNQIFVVIKNLGATPARLDKLDTRVNEVYNQCVQYDLHVEEYHKHPESILLTFPNKKPSLDYKEHFLKLYRSGGLTSIVEFLNKSQINALPLVYDRNWDRLTWHHLPTWHCIREPETHISEILEREFSFIVIRLDDRLVKQIMNIQHIPWRTALIKGMYRSLLRATCYESRIELKEDVTSCAMQFFQRKDIPVFFDFYSTEIWIRDMEKYINSNPQDTPRLNAFFNVLVPIFKQKLMSLGYFQDLNTAVSLRNIANKAIEQGFQQLKAWVLQLEDQLIKHAEQLEKEASSLTFYLEVFIRYPFSENEKEMLINNLKKTSKVSLKQWLIDPMCYFDILPEDHFNYGVTGDFLDTVFFKEDQESIELFFTELQCDNILGELSSEYSKVIDRWNKIIDKNPSKSAT